MSLQNVIGGTKLKTGNDRLCVLGSCLLYRVFGINLKLLEWSKRFTYLLIFTRIFLSIIVNFDRTFTYDTDMISQCE